MRRCGLFLLLAVLTLYAILPLKAFAGEEALYNSTKDFANFIISDAGHVLSSPERWGRKEWSQLYLCTAGVGALMVLDKPIYDVIQKNRSNSLDSFADFVEEFGSYPSFGIMGGFYAAGVMYNDSKAKAVAVDAFATSIVAAGVITTSLKVITGRSRPNAGDGTHHFQPFGGDRSFPSGHTAQAFSLASVIAEHYNEQWVDLTSYGIATMVGLARIEQEAHFPSDVLAGAIIGTVVGKSIVRFNKGRHGKYTLLPVMDGQTTGVLARVEF